ncbi:MAG TPA: ABC transporter permease [Allosphingosinicella sp.]|jgi:sulfonate transport system permease protein
MLWLRGGEARTNPYLRIVGIFLCAIVWEGVARRVGNPVLVPSLERIAGAFVLWDRSGTFVADCLESLPRAYLAIIFAIPPGIALGIALGMSRAVDSLLNAPVQFVRCLPPVALLPLFILWFGIDWWAKLGSAAFVCVFPVTISTVQAARAVDRQYRELALDLRLSATRYLKQIVLPGTLPAIVPGIRLAAGTSFVMVFVSELAGASAGLGYRIEIAQLAYQADLMLAALLILGGAGLATDAAIVGLSRRMLHYAGR